ncbi:uncharacterized protein SCHCODRAFT_02473312, partial [Schizophyllum commune H4-8]|uniref:uncharacterized protein n=1 Tax=Schizophyllum commune (strain H4-8 / FGSC 9210) TaxID=578458 RepID=UPI00216072C0
DPFAREGLPADVGMNPHRWLTQRGDAPATPNPGHARITETPTLHVVIPRYRLFANSSQVQVDAALAEPKKWVVLVPYGAGRSFNAKVTHFGDSVLALLRTFLFGTQTEPEDMEIVKILPASNNAQLAGENTSYQQPWGWFLRCGEDLHKWLLWKERISAGIDKTFAVYSLETFEDSWKIATLSGDVISADAKGERMWDILGHVKNACWNEKRFRNFVIDVSRQNNFTGTHDELMTLATNSWELVPAEHKDDKGKTTRVYILTGRPISLDDMVRQTWIALINDVKIWVGLHKIDTKAFQSKISCTWCKSDMHCAHTCPVAQVEDWYGP